MGSDPNGIGSMIHFLRGVYTGSDPRTVGVYTGLDPFGIYELLAAL